jgi:hypothetical protein
VEVLESRRLTALRNAARLSGRLQSFYIISAKAKYLLCILADRYGGEPMDRLKLLLNVVILFAMLTSACSGSSSIPPDPATTDPTNPQPITQPEMQPTAQPASQNQPTAPANGSEQAVLLFGIGLHIEPFGAVPSDLAGRPARQKPQNTAGNGQRNPDYNQLPFFEHHVQDIQTVAGIIEEHGGKLTIQTQTPFTQVAIDTGNSILSDLAQRGHEIALHFHEDAHLGPNPENLPVETWCTVMREEIDLIQQASGVDKIRYWSGGNLYPGIFEAAACAGLEVNSDWKNPETQSTPLELTGLNPWRPAGGTDGTDLSLITQNDPQGAVIFLPEGLYDRGNFASMRRSATTGGDQAYFDFLAQSLRNSLAAAKPGRVSVFHFTIHAGEFRGDIAQPFAVIERFLSEVVDPLVASGQVRWATFSEMADTYAAPETDSVFNPAPTPAAASPKTAQSTPAFSEMSGHLY